MPFRRYPPRNLELSICGDVSFEWRQRTTNPRISRGAGNDFFCARWDLGEAKLGLFGIHHKSLLKTEDHILEFARSVTALDMVREILSDLSAHIPGWGFFWADRDRLQIWRDPVGRLPMFWSRPDSETIEWSTRPATLGSFKPSVSVSKLQRFLDLTWDNSREDYWEGVSRIRPGETLVFDHRKRVSFMLWWPDRDLKVPDIAVEQRIVDLLFEEVGRIGERGGQVISLSGGVDSTVLLTMMVEKGLKPKSLTMVAAGTVVFDEREAVSKTLSKLKVDGKFFDVTGRESWDTPEVHHHLLDFGPASHPEAAYKTRLMEAVKETSQSATLISGIGADHIFGCHSSDYFQDVLSSYSGWSEAFSENEWKEMFKKVMRVVGFRRFPYCAHSKPSAKWLRDYESRRDIEMRNLFSEENWFLQRASVFHGWDWENAMRLLERYRRTIGVLYEAPYLSTNILEIAMALRPRTLRSSQFDNRPLRANKWPLRAYLQHRVDSDVAMAKKRGTFDEIVWAGLLNYLSPILEELFSNSHLCQYGLLDQQGMNETIAELRFDQNRIEWGGIGSVRFWRAVSGELWLRQQELLEDQTGFVRMDLTVGNS